jgi:hypothetical protein
MWNECILKSIYVDDYLKRKSRRKKEEERIIIHSFSFFLLLIMSVRNVVPTLTSNER